MKLIVCDAVRLALKALRSNGIQADIIKMYGTNQYLITLPQADIKEEDDNKPTTKIPPTQH